jgi:hypothetical protein
MLRPRRNSPHVAAPKERKAPLSSLSDVGNASATLSPSNSQADTPQQSQSPCSQPLPPGVRYEPDLAAGYAANAERHKQIYTEFKQLISGR